MKTRKCRELLKTEDKPRTEQSRGVTTILVFKVARTKDSGSALSAKHGQLN